jgi:ribonuclease BN (tRNA processing enzyme)
MRLEILGCHGGELPGCRSTCFLVDGTLALDAGSLTATLDLSALARVDHIVLTHSHFDHVKDLPLLSDLVVGRRETPVTIWASHTCTRALQENLFNGTLWPDFTRIPSAEEPVFRIRSFAPGESFQAGPHAVRSVLVRHPVESCGFVVQRNGSALAISGDTGPTEQLWEVLNRTPNLKALLLETSFPDELQDLADLSGHLTPRTLRSELRKFQRNGTDVLLYHLKPAYLAELKSQVAGLPVRVLELGETYEL